VDKPTATGTLTHEQQLCEARRLLRMPHPAEQDEDDVVRALWRIDFRDRLFSDTRKFRSKQGRRTARSLAKAIMRARARGDVPVPSFLAYHRYVATEPPGVPKRADAFKKRLALWQAFALLDERGRSCVASRGGDWCRLGAILYGDPTADLLPQARALLRILKAP
jgi:hypothetical protein